MARRFKITAPGKPYNGVDFEVADDATEEEIANAASEAVMQYVSFGWEEIESKTDEATASS